MLVPSVLSQANKTYSLHYWVGSKNGGKSNPQVAKHTSIYPWMQGLSVYVRSVGEEVHIHKQQRKFEAFHNKRLSSGAHPSTIRSHLPSIVLA